MAKAEKRHYDNEALLEEYRSTFSMFMTVLAVAVGGAVLFFFVFIFYLGGWSHTKATPFVKDFGGRIEYEYHGTKLPMFGGPEAPEQKEHH